MQAGLSSILRQYFPCLISYVREIFSFAFRQLSPEP